MREKLDAVICETGIWDGNRKQTHGFLLSPSVYQITKEQKKELQRLGFALYDCLLGLSHIAVIAYDKSLNYQGQWLLARKVFSTGVPSMYQEMQGMNVRNIPALLKVDLMVNQDGEFFIAEVDGHNKHGVGYSTLAKLFREALYPEYEALPGVVRLLSDEIRRQGYRDFKLLYAEQEKFYIPEFEVACREFVKNGIDCKIVSEMDADKAFVSEGMFLDLPFLYHQNRLYDTIIPAYLDGNVRFVIPPKPFLGAKGVLGLLRNDGKDDELEALLRTFIKKDSLKLLRKYIPETVLVGKLAEDFETAKKRTARKRYVLKESISSGMKGTVFSDDQNFESILSLACSSNLNWILQEEIINQPQEFSWFDKGDSPLNTSSDWFMRVTVQYVNRQLADVIVTARRDKAVHGAPDCIQIGTAIV